MVRIHDTAVVEHGVTIGEGSSVWDNVHIRHGASLGESCIVGGKSYIAYDVQIGNRVKINSNAYICNGVTIEDGVMVSAGVIFTNDRYPRATDPTLQTLRGSDPDESTLSTLVRCGATIGAGAIIGCGIEIGAWAMVGMGAVVTRNVPAHGIVVGNPAKVIGFACRCGQPVVRFGCGDDPAASTADVACRCGLRYKLANRLFSEVER